MLTTIRSKSQITIPKSVMAKIGLAVGDSIEISVRDGGIFIFPVRVSRVVNERSYKLAEIR